MSTQQEFWDREHLKPKAFSQLAQVHMSAAVLRFHDWIKELKVPLNNGISMGCGKGRNEIGLAILGIEMTGLDFSLPAVVEAEKRARMLTSARFYQHDITTSWPIESNSYDIGLDCFALADVESSVGRRFAAQEMMRVLRPNGYLLVYTLSPEDEYSAHWRRTSPRKEEPNTYTPPSVVSPTPLYHDSPSR